MNIVDVAEHNLDVYMNLAQGYESEFSAITRKKPNERGLFELDTQIEGNVKGLLLLVEGAPAGLAAIAAKPENRYEVCEFYVVPYFRKQSWGAHFAHAIWRRFPGRWEVKQIAGAEYATIFWRKVIGDFTHSAYTEDQYEDAYWGPVIRQQFNSSYNGVGSVNRR